MKKYALALKQKRPYLLTLSDKEYGKEKIRTPDEAAEAAEEAFHIKSAAEEHMVMIALDYRLCALGIFEVSHGTVNASIASPREIYIRALLIGASCIILVHNHPSGDETPSKEDEAVAQRIANAGKIIGIKLLDSVIVGNGIVSLFEKQAFDGV